MTRGSVGGDYVEFQTETAAEVCEGFGPLDDGLPGGRFRQRERSSLPFWNLRKSRIADESAEDGIVFVGNLLPKYGRVLAECGRCRELGDGFGYEGREAFGGRETLVKNISFDCGLPRRGG